VPREEKGGGRRAWGRKDLQRGEETPANALCEHGRKRSGRKPRKGRKKEVEFYNDMSTFSGVEGLVKSVVSETDCIGRENTSASSTYRAFDEPGMYGQMIEHPGGPWGEPFFQRSARRA